MAILSIDTHAFVKKLTSTGIPEKQAEAFADALAKINLEDVATRGDWAELRDQLQREIQQLRLNIGEMKFEILKWIIPLLLAQTAVFATLVQWMTA